MTTAERNPKYVALLAAAAAAILVLGALLRPAPSAPTVTSAPSEADLVRLARLSQRRALENTAAYFAAVADQVTPSLLHLPERRATATAWARGVAIAPAAPGPAPAAVAASAMGSRHVAARVAVSGPELPLVSLDLAAGDEVPPVTPAPAGPAAGDWVVLVWRTAESRAFAQATLSGTTTVTCGGSTLEALLLSVPLAAGSAGGGLFDLDGNLLAIVLPCGTQLAAIPHGEVEAMLRRAAAMDQRLLGAVGMRVSALAPQEAQQMKATGGVVVREIWDGYPADCVDLRPGDVIQSLGGNAVRLVEDLAPLASGARAALGIRRFGKDLEIALGSSPGPPSAAREADSGTGLIWEPLSAGVDIESVVEGSAAAGAGVRAGDRLLRIDGVEPHGPREIERLLGRTPAAPVYLELWRSGRRWGVLLS